LILGSKFYLAEIYDNIIGNVSLHSNVKRPESLSPFLLPVLINSSINVASQIENYFNKERLAIVVDDCGTQRIYHKLIEEIFGKIEMNDKENLIEEVLS